MDELTYKQKELICKMYAQGFSVKELAYQFNLTETEILVILGYE